MYFILCALKFVVLSFMNNEAIGLFMDLKFCSA